jgi:hydroxymethylpyrimidine pyrophosphatase-like HAD family hydrolase
MLASKFLKIQNAPLKDLVFFFDFDGSLCPHLEVWQERSYDPDRIEEILSSLHRSSRGVFWNTGRRVESLASVNEKFLQFSGYFIQGSLKWDASTQTQIVCGPLLPQELASYYQKCIETQHTLRLEIKASSLRVAPYQSGSMKDLGFFMAKYPLPPAFQKQWSWHQGARGAELLALGYNKAFALRDYYSLPQSQGALPVVVGDDSFDRPAIEESLRRGGYAVLVGEHCGWATEIEHKVWQITYCDQPSDVLNLLLNLK